jgi:hypothetical protein
MSNCIFLVFHASFYWGILIFKGLTARRLYKSFGVKELKCEGVSWLVLLDFVGVSWSYIRFKLP